MHIMLALDGSKHSMEAARFLARMPFRDPPRVTIVTALLESPYDEMTPETRTTLHEAEEEDVHKNVLSAKLILENRCSEIEQLVERRHPSQLILDVANERQADLIVLGNYGHSAAYRILLGSTADYVANHAKCSVLIVRSTAQEEEPSNPSGFRVLLAYDGSPSSQTAFEQLQKFEWAEEDTRIQIAMMLERPKLIPDDIVYDPDLVAESEAAVGELKRLSGFACPVTQTVRETLDVGSALGGIAERDNSNLLFFGNSGKSALSRLFIGSTSRYLLHHAKCSVWIARKPTY